MLGIDLSTLSMQELRQLLEVARNRGQESLIRQLEVELSTRPGRLSGRMPQPMSAVAAPVMPVVRQSRGPSPGAATAIAATAAVVGAALAWGVSTNLQLPAQAALKPQAASLTSAAGPAPRIAVALTQDLPQAEPEMPAEEPEQPQSEDPPATAVAHATARLAAIPERGRRNPCLDLPTARERLICGYPTIATRDRDMTAAYDRALAAGADAKTVDAGQTAWRQANAEVMDRQVLAERYDRRIRELEAAAASAPARN